MRRVSAKFVPKLLTIKQKQRRLEIAQDMLDNANSNPNFLSITKETTLKAIRVLYLQINKCISADQRFDTFWTHHVWEAASLPATQEFPKNLRNPKVHFGVHNSHLLVSILSQINPANVTPSYFSKIYFLLSSHLHLDFLRCLFPSGVPTKILYLFLYFPCVLDALTVSSTFTWSFWLYLEKSKIKNLFIMQFSPN
jgi:hypothetical protein